MITTGGSSTGAEALIKGKKLLNFGGAYYVGILPNERFSLLIVIQIRMSSLVKAPKTHVELFLKNTIKAKYDFFNRSKSSLNPEDWEIVEKIVRYAMRVE